MNSDNSNQLIDENTEEDVLNPDISSIHRRKFVAMITLASAALLTGVDNVYGGIFYSTRPVDGIPDSWVKEKGADVLKYANYVKGLKLKNISPEMVLRPHFKKRGSLSNSLPPRYMWKRIGDSLKVIDRLSYELKSPVKDLLSIYRSPSYNRSCGGKSLSQHMENRAIDVKFSRASSYAAARQAKKLRDKGYFKGGIGTYSTFLHIDTRGSNATW